MRPIKASRGGVAPPLFGRRNYKMPTASRDIVISNKLGNVPDRYSWVTRARTPGAALPPTYYFKS